jgi:Family of unknown function (DUF5677)
MEASEARHGLSFAANLAARRLAESFPSSGRVPVAISWYSRCGRRIEKIMVEIDRTWPEKKVSVKEQLTEYIQELSDLKSTVDLAFGKDVRSSSGDVIIFPLLVSCRGLLEEVLFASSEGFGQLALRSARTMYECVVLARYLSRHPEKMHDYLQSFYSQWASILRNLPDVATSMPGVHKAVIANVPAYAEGKHIDPTAWNEKKTFQMAKEMGFPASLHSLAFNYTSGFIHPSVMLLIGGVEVNGDVLEVGNKSQDDEARSALKIAHILILNAMDLRLAYASSVSLTEQLEARREDFMKIWGYPSPI